MSAVHFLSRSSVYVISSNAVGSFLLFYYYLFGIFWGADPQKTREAQSSSSGKSIIVTHFWRSL